MTKKTLIAITAVVLVLFCTVGATLAWLVATTGEVKNTFTYGDIDITLWEHTLVDGSLSTTTTTTTGNANYKMIPGSILPKDPTVTVKADSEACYLFVEITESTNFSTYFDAYTIDTGWTKGDGTNIPANVYYRTVDATTADTSFNILKDKQVKVKSAIIKDQFNSLTTIVNGVTTNSYPTLTFKAYAVQQANVADAKTAWGYAK